MQIRDEDIKDIVIRCFIVNFLFSGNKEFMTLTSTGVGL